MRRATITEAQEKLYNDFKRAEAITQIYALDNEKSKDLINIFENEKIQYQLVTSYKHRNN